MTREQKRENSTAVIKNTGKETSEAERREEERRGNESTKENCILFFNLLTPLSAAQKTC
jgi:hypothetical protein